VSRRLGNWLGCAVSSYRDSRIETLGTIPGNRGVLSSICYARLTKFYRVYAISINPATALSMEVLVTQTRLAGWGVGQARPAAGVVG
jgi:hypothetical protein